MIPARTGGVAAKPIKTGYSGLKQDLCLRVAPVFYHMMLVIRGFNRVYEISKLFYNEGIIIIMIVLICIIIMNIIFIVMKTCKY